MKILNKVPVLQNRSNDDGDISWEYILEVYFTFGFRNYLNLFSTPIGLKIGSNKYITPSIRSETNAGKISRRGLRSPEISELGHFTLLFSRGRLQNEQRLITLMHSSVIFVVWSEVFFAVVVSLSSLLGNTFEILSKIPPD